MSLCDAQKQWKPLGTHAPGVRDFRSRPAVEDPHAGGVRTHRFSEE
jgi:hypothetical protein